jgi:hypothetical protein
MALYEIGESPWLHAIQNSIRVKPPRKREQRFALALRERQVARERTSFFRAGRPSRGGSLRAFAASAPNSALATASMRRAAVR